MEPWINHDRHRAKVIEKVTAKVIKTKTPRKVRPYPTEERVRELFNLVDGVLIRKKPHGNERPDRIAGCINQKCGHRYILVDGKNCRADTLIHIYMGR